MMKLFKRSLKKPNRTSLKTPTQRNNLTVADVRNKLADYQKTEGRACFIQSQDLAYLADGSVDFETVKVGKESVQGFAIPFAIA